MICGVAPPVRERERALKYSLCWMMSGIFLFFSKRVGGFGMYGGSGPGRDGASAHIARTIQ